MFYRIKDPGKDHNKCCNICNRLSKGWLKDNLPELGDSYSPTKITTQKEGNYVYIIDSKGKLRYTINNGCIEPYYSYYNYVI